VFDELPDNQIDREAYLRDINAGKLVEILKSGDEVLVEIDSSWEPETILVAVAYAMGAGATIKMIVRPKGYGLRSLLEESS
jgi:hypothetical protein